jgi:hypothetical protein
VAAVLLAFALVAAGCGRPADEAWLRVLQFEDEDGVTSVVTSVLESTTTSTSTTTTTTTTTTTENTSVEPLATDYVTAVLVNQSTIPGSDAQAEGVTVEQVRIRYSIPGYSPSDVVIPVSLYVAASAGDAEATGTSLKLPLVSVELKNWLLERVPDDQLERGFSGSAELTFRAVTDAGLDLETNASIRIEFVSLATSTDDTSTTTELD